MPATGGSGGEESRLSVARHQLVAPSRPGSQGDLSLERGVCSLLFSDRFCENLYAREMDARASWLLKSNVSSRHTRQVDDVLALSCLGSPYSFATRAALSHEPDLEPNRHVPRILFVLTSCPRRLAVLNPDSPNSTDLTEINLNKLASGPLGVKCKAAMWIGLIAR